MDQITWKKFLETVRPIKASVEILLRSARPVSFEDNELKIAVNYKFHKESLEEVKNIQILEEALKEVLQKDVHMCFELADTTLSKPISTDVPNSQNGNISDVAEEIFSL